MVGWLEYGCSTTKDVGRKRAEDKDKAKQSGLSLRNALLPPRHCTVLANSRRTPPPCSELQFHLHMYFVDKLLVRSASKAIVSPTLQNAIYTFIWSVLGALLTDDQGGEKWHSLEKLICYLRMRPLHTAFDLFKAQLPYSPSVPSQYLLSIWFGTNSQAENCVPHIIGIWGIEMLE